MLGPIPNSLGAGAYNGSYFPHGLVTFSTRSFRVIVRQQVCVAAEVVTLITLDAVMNAEAILAAGYVDAVPVGAEVITVKTATGEVVTIRAITGLVEEC
jgi:hypothetical protein